MMSKVLLATTICCGTCFVACKPKVRIRVVEKVVVRDVGVHVQKETLTNQQKIEVRKVARRNSLLVHATISRNRGSRGSGFVVKRFDEKCVVLTNAHVVMHGGLPAKRIRVKSALSGKYLRASLLFFFRRTGYVMDFAYLVVHDARHLLGQEVDFAQTVNVGDYVIAAERQLHLCAGDNYICA